MYHVIFQVRPSEDGYQLYLDTAARLRPQLDAIKGFVSIERFRSVDNGPWILSLSKWADEAALVKWRATPEHHEAQRMGRERVFDDYRLRVAQVAARARPRDPEWKPERRTPYRIAQGPARFVSVLEITGIDRAALPSPAGASDSEWYESLADPGKYAWVIGWNGEAEARQWHDEVRAMLDAHDGCEGCEGCEFELSLTELERDYGLFPREEAPQYFPPATRPAMQKERFS